MANNSRRNFLKRSGYLAGAAVAGSLLPTGLSGGIAAQSAVPLSGHLWVYASKFPPDWDCTPILDEVFRDFKYAGLQGVEMMEVHLRHADVVPRVKELIQKHGVPVTGTSYNGDMWDRAKHQEIREDVELVVERLHQLGGTTFGITVGDARRRKTEAELDAQADLLKAVLQVCAKNKVQANLHNHTFEVKDNLHDFRGTVQRVPELKLGPDINWLIRGGVDPVWFIHSYGKQMVYLHLRDQDASGQWTRAVGEGVTDFPAIAQALRKVNFQGRAAIELAFETPPVTPVREDWRKSREYVRQVFGW
jgi:sugar phosphate isomerase/epimerase